MSLRRVSLFTATVLTVPMLALSAPAVAATAPAQAPATAVAAKNDFCRIAAATAAVRSKPRRSAARLVTAHRGDSCTAHGWAEGDGTWVKVTMKRTGVTGYVHSSRVAWGKEELVSTGS
ncbi:SH3 domain-containing protein [Streptomyces sp. NPDC047081]|uniref:SH3 domain-containing protein n=1 Tax=Streptomyces sp. NPDC047081 TaxID=3154706 RepID=UPI00340AC842